MNTSRLGFAAVAAALLLSGCAGRSMSRYDWSLYHRIKLATPEAIEHHIEVLEEILAEAAKEDRAPRPGACAELGYYLMLAGKADRGMDILDREVMYYPESARFVLVLKRLTRGEKKILTSPTSKEAQP